MSKLLTNILENYVAPVCESVNFTSEAVICDTSFNGGDIAPGQGQDWGLF